MKKDNKKIMPKRTNSNTKTKKDKNTSQNNLNNKKKYSKSTKSNTISSNISKEKNSIPKEKEIKKDTIKKNTKSTIKNIKSSSSKVEKNSKLYKDNEKEIVKKNNDKSKTNNIKNNEKEIVKKNNDKSKTNNIKNNKKEIVKKNNDKSKTNNIKNNKKEIVKKNNDKSKTNNIKNNKKSNNKKIKHNKILKIYKFIYFILFIIIFGMVIVEFNKYYSYKEHEKLKQERIEKLTDIKNSYSTYVKAKNGSYIYFKEDKEYKKNCLIHGEIELTLDDNYKIEDEYYKILNTNYYVKYNDLVPSSELSNRVGEYLYYKNYIPFNESIVLKDNAKLYVNNENYYELMVGDKFEIIINEDDKYGIEYNNSLVYVNKNDVLKNIKNDLSENEYAEDIAVLNYHYVVSSTNEGGELVECKSEICITDIKFDSHIKYLADNNYYGVSMRDLELFIEDKIRLPKNSVSITIDDGWYVSRAITILEKYKINATLFLIGSLASPNDYKSNYLEVHSHSWDMHKLGVCPSTVGRGGILCLDDKIILEDLKKSRESLNNTTYFCYPFYDYNERAIKLLKEAGFTMAFAGQINNSKVKVGQNKFKIPRFVIVNSTSMDNFINYIS